MLWARHAFGIVRPDLRAAECVVEDALCGSEA